MNQANSSHRLNRLELKQLRVLQALLRERNLSRVADQMSVSQQTISEQLKRLRDIFQDHLFVRTSNGVIPTPLAERLQPRVDQLLKQVSGLLEPEAFDPEQVEGIFSISATDFEQSVILPPLIHALRAQAPGLKVVIHKLELDLMARQLASGEVDLVLSNPDFVPDSSPIQLLYRESYLCIASANRELPDQAMSLKQLADLPQLVVSPSRGDFRGMVDTWFEAEGLQRNVVLSVPSFASAVECISATDTLAFLPSRLVLDRAGNIKDNRLRRVELTDQPPGFDVIAAWHVRSGQDPLHCWIRDLLTQQCYTSHA